MELTDGAVNDALLGDGLGQEIEGQSAEVTLEDLKARIDSLGQQMNWLCENMASLFMFVQTVSSNGGGIRGLMKAMKTEQPGLIAEVKDAG